MAGGSGRPIQVVLPRISVGDDSDAGMPVKAIPAKEEPGGKVPPDAGPSSEAKAKASTSQDKGPPDANSKSAKEVKSEAEEGP